MEDINEMSLKEPHPFLACPRCKGPLKVIVKPKKDLTCSCGYRASAVEIPKQ